MAQAPQAQAPQAQAPQAQAPQAQAPQVQQPEQLAAQLREAAEEAGLAALGFTPAIPMDDVRAVLEERKAAGLAGTMQFTYRNPARSADPSRLLPGAASLVVGAWPYAQASKADGHAMAGPVEPELPGGPGSRSRPRPGARPQGRVARYATRDHYREMDAALGAVAAVLVSRGWRARVVSDDNGLVDRAAAQRAGLGWFGKNANILLPGQGSWFVLGAVVTDAVLPCSSPVAPGCGSCQRCMVSCPTGALVAPGVVDARRCLAWLAQAPGPIPPEYREAMGDRIYGCDDCQEACPPNRLADRAGPGGPASSEVTSAERTAPGPPAAGNVGQNGTGGHRGPQVDLLAMLAASDEELLGAYGRWYIANRDPRYLRRNALVALGNVLAANRAKPGASGGAVAAEVESVLRSYLAGPDEMLSQHAAWAAGRAGLSQLVALAKR